MAMERTLKTKHGAASLSDVCQGKVDAVFGLLSVPTAEWLRKAPEDSRVEIVQTIASLADVVARTAESPPIAIELTLVGNEWVMRSQMYGEVFFRVQGESIAEMFAKTMEKCAHMSARERTHTSLTEWAQAFGQMCERLDSRAFDLRCSEHDQRHPEDDAGDGSSSEPR